MNVSNDEHLKDNGSAAQTEKDVRAEAPVLFVEPRTLLRQCFEECFRLSAAAARIVAIPDIAEWIRMADRQSLPSAVFLYVPATASVRSAIETVTEVFSDHDAVPPIIIVADNEDPAHVLDALDVGAKGYVPSSVSLEVAVEALHLVLAGGTYVPASALIASRHMAKDAAEASERSPNAFFTDRQHAVIEKLREGKPNKIIAYELNMRESTVKVHIRNLMRKLNATNRTQVAYLYQAMLSENSTGVGN
ncbi:response regulator transcription factor [Microbaculum marinisediminis]|uniref:Response regulator transcription factor n=1 Tax=Microbaculum marinisediminis TaxID=2931392 RepID=A0AAW5R0A1_9HYPH|nr:response regulator transcription factor [Microbaculum sp. A6E488]MCT8973701.1 response regulator transcription factor [Microbaculum sp. A6E488]